MCFASAGRACATFVEFRKRIVGDASGAFAISLELRHLDDGFEPRPGLAYDGVSGRPRVVARLNIWPR